MGFNPLSRLLQRLTDDADSDPVADGGAVAADQQGADQSDTQAPPSPSVEGKAESDEQTVVDVDLPTGEDARLVVDAPVSPDAIGDVVEAKGGSVSRGVQGQADDGTVIPVSTQDEDLDLSDTYFDSEEFDFDFIRDDRIQDVREKQIDYNQRVGRYIMHKDDLVPSIKERIKGLIMGEDGLSVEPDDPDADADQQLADHLEEVYEGRSDVAPTVKPADVIDDILDQNFMNARWVGRITDLRYLDLESLELVVDGESGDKIYVQEATGYTTFQVDEDDEQDAIDFDVETSDPQALEVGEDVLDASLYDRPPLEAVADDVVGKMEMKFLKARKAQIGSVGGLFIRVTPPEYLPEDEYFDRTQNPFTDDPDDTITKLEKELQQGIDRAFDTLQDYKSGTVMAIPNNWEVDQIDLPDSPQPLDDQIRGYNQSIARRLLYPLDLVELKSGPELSRETLFRTVINTLQGWREEILTVFDDFAETQKEIHDLSGDVSHTFPAFANEDEKLLVSALQYAGPAGMTEKEVRQTLNSLEGFDLDTDRDEGDMPPAGGPTDPTQRQDSMDDMLNPDADQSGDQPPDQQPPGTETENGGQQPDDFTSGPQPDGSDQSPQQAQAQFTPPEGLDLYELDGWTQASVWDAYLSLGGQHSTCSTRMTGELRNPDAWCAALKDEALGTDLWRQGSGAAPKDGLQGGAAARCWAADPRTAETTASLDEVADAVSSAVDDLTELQSEDDYVAFSRGGVDPREASGDDGDASPDDFDPVTVVKAGESDYDFVGLSDDEVQSVMDELPDAPDDAEGSQGNLQGADGDGPLSHIPNVPDDPDRLTRAMLQEIVRWKAGQAAEDKEGLTVSVGRQFDGEASRAVQAGSEFSRHFNPSLHPRNPDSGKFVERPFDFDLDQRTLDNTPTPDLLQFLKDEGEPVDQWIAGDSMSIDGIPNDAEGLDDARDKIRERGVPDPDEVGQVDPDDLPDGAIGPVLSDEEQADLSVGDVVTYEDDFGEDVVGRITQREGDRMTVEIQEGAEDDLPVTTNKEIRQVDSTEFSSVQEQELGVRPDDFDTSGDDSGFNGNATPGEEARAIAQDVVQAVEDNDNVPSLSSGAAWEERSGARAGSSPGSTGDMEADQFRQLRNRTAKALQAAMKEHEDLDRQAVKMVLSDLDRMKGKSYSDAGKTFESALQDAMDLPGDLRNDDKSIKPHLDDDYQQASEVMSAVSGEVFRELHGDEATLHRGIQTTGGAQLVNGVLQSDPDDDGTFTFSENVIANYSAAENVAQDFARSAWVTRTATPDDVAHSSDDMLGDRSSFRGEGEIALGTGESTVRYGDVKIKSNSGDEPVSVGDIFGSDPEELGLAEMVNANEFIEYLDKRDVAVPDQSDVPDSMQDWLESYTQRASDSGIVNMRTGTRLVIRQVLGDERFSAARQGDS